MLTFAKRVLIGRPLATSEQEHQRLPKTIALATFSSDAISSTAYATEEILFVTALGASSLALGLAKLVPIAAVVAVLLAIVVFSYRKTIYAYPRGGGSYLVSKDNLGEMPSLVAGASLLVDYILTVAVSISSGVAAIISIPSFRDLEQYRVLLCLVLVLLVTLANLRGIKESGKLFAVPTYIYIVSLGGLLLFGLTRSYFGDLEPVPFDEHATEAASVGGSLSLYILLRGFSSGAVALSGVEAISDGVPVFRRPEARNAARTLVTMAVILGTLFFGVSMLAQRLEPYPSHDETVISQMSRVVFGEGPYYWILQFATAGILVLAANTAYADFPRLSSIIARDGFLPRQFANRGDRLVFSNGVVFLGVAASVLIVAFGGITSALIPLYAIGVFTSFTLSQAGMFRRQQTRREPGWKSGMIISAVGTVATFAVAVIVGVTKFAIGAWVPIIVVPLIVILLKSIKRHYTSVSAVLAIEPEDVPVPPARHTFVVLVSRVHIGVVEAINYARSLRPDHITALHIADEPEEHAEIQREWERYAFDIPLDIVDSPYRELVQPVEHYLDALDARWDTDRVTVVIPEFVMGLRNVANVLHGQSALALKLALLDRPNTAVISVPYHVHAAPAVPRVEAPFVPVGVQATAPSAQPSRAPGKRARLTAGLDELERARLATKYAPSDDGAPSIADLPTRERVRITGEVTASRVVPRRGSPSLELTLGDGTGTVKVVFTGRRGIPGLEPGRSVRIEGVAREETGGLVVLNPTYTLLS